MEARLVVIGGKTNHSEIKLKLPSVFGRGREADITIAHPAVSRNHCRIEEVDGALVLRDTGSTNGTFFGKQRINQMVIRPGDQFSVGPLTFRAEYDHSGSFPAVGDPRPTTTAEDATIQLPGGAGEAPADGDLDFGTGEPAAATADQADELDFMSDAEPAKAAVKDADELDFLGDSEPAEAAPAAAEVESEPDAEHDDFLAAFDEDEPVASHVASEQELADDLPELDFDEPVAEPKAAEPAVAADDLDFELLAADTDAAASHEEDTTELAVSPLSEKQADVAADDELEFAPAGAGEVDFDLTDDVGVPAAAEPSSALDDLGGDDEPAAEGKPAATAKTKQKPGKEKDKEAKKGWFSFGKASKKAAPKERKHADEPAAAEMPDLEMPDLEPAAEEQPAEAAELEMPDFLAAEEPAPSKPKPAATKPSKPAAEKKASPANSKPAETKQAADEPDLDFLGSGSPAAPAAAEDDGLDDFFKDLGL